ncbi:hypothetical protein AC1031_008494 [Aphanomyces cochlioides]|nr:hypothetical protein AC1031_008494 [Aphanomyces cochlioides]
MSDVDQAYTDLHERFVYLQQQTNRLGSAYVLATQELKSLKEDNQILKDKLIEIRLRRRKLAAQAETNMIANMNAKTLFCRQNRRVLRKQFPLISRDQLTAFVEEEWESLAPEVAEKWHREFKAFVPKPTKQSKAPKEERSTPSADVTPVKKAPPKSRRKPAASTPTDDSKPKPKRATPKKKSAPAGDASSAGGDKKPPKRATPPKRKTNVAAARGAKRDKPAPSKPQDENDNEDDDDDPIDDNSSGNSSIAPSDEDDSDDNLMHLPTGAFG